MQIDGARDFFSRITSLTKPTAGARNGSPLSILSPFQGMFKTDYDVPFRYGKKLSFAEARVTDSYNKYISLCWLQTVFLFGEVYAYSEKRS